MGKTPIKVLSLFDGISCARQALHDLGIPVSLYYASEVDKYALQISAQRWQELEPKDMHVRFEKIHPFVDGNGRTGRMLMWLHEYWLGREPTLIRSNEADRHYYYQWFREAQND